MLALGEWSGILEDRHQNYSVSNCVLLIFLVVVALVVVALAVVAVVAVVVAVGHYLGNW